MFAFHKIFSISRCGWYIVIPHPRKSNRLEFLRVYRPLSYAALSHSWLVVWCYTGAGQSSSLNQRSSHLPPPPTTTPILSTNLGAKGRHETTDVDGGRRRLPITSRGHISAVIALFSFQLLLQLPRSCVVSFNGSVVPLVPRGSHSATCHQNSFRFSSPPPVVISVIAHLKPQRWRQHHPGRLFCFSMEIVFKFIICSERQPLSL